MEHCIYRVQCQTCGDMGVSESLALAYSVAQRHATDKRHDVDVVDRLAHKVLKTCHPKRKAVGK